MLSSYPTCQGVSMRALLASLRKPPSVTGAFLVTPVLALLPPSSHFTSHFTAGPGNVTISSGT